MIMFNIGNYTRIRRNPVHDGMTIPISSAVFKTPLVDISVVFTALEGRQRTDAERNLRCFVGSAGFVVLRDVLLKSRDPHMAGGEIPIFVHINIAVAHGCSSPPNIVPP